MNNQFNNHLAQPFTPAVSVTRSTLSASEPSNKSSSATSTYSVHLQRNFVQRLLSSARTTRLQRLQETGVLDKIKNMHLSDTEDDIDEKEEDKVSSSGTGTTCYEEAKPIESVCSKSIVEQKPQNAFVAPTVTPCSKLIAENTFAPPIVTPCSRSTVQQEPQNAFVAPIVTPCAKSTAEKEIENAFVGPIITPCSRPTLDQEPQKVPQVAVATPSDDQNAKKSTRKELRPVSVNGKSYYLLSSLGQGGSSKVYQVYDPVNQRNCAVKIVDLKNADESVRAGYENEITLLTKLSDCKRVVKLYDYERLMSNGIVRRLYLVMEKGDADLNQILRNSIEKDPDSPGGLKIDPHTIKFYWKEMLKAVDEIHQKDVVHADLKPVNFITVSGKLKLIDFGIANAIETDHTSVIKDNQIGTINFMAPEALYARNDITPTSFNKPMIKFNCKADIWSLGCILYNLVYGKSPFSQFNSTYAKIQAICNSQFLIEFPPISDEDLLDCLKVSFIFFIYYFFTLASYF